MTVASNQFQSHNQLLRHGMLNWVTRGVFLGYQRNYLELQVDDLFLGDDAWDPATNTTNYDPAAASRMTPADVDRAIAWSQARGVRLDFAFNGGGSDALREQTGAASDPLTAKFSQPGRAAARSASSTTPTSTRTSTARRRPYITRQITRNLTWAQSRGIAVASPGELVTGEHSGLANSRPGNPGTIDPPSFDDVERQRPAAPCPPGTYDYALTARSPAGETDRVSVVHRRRGRGRRPRRRELQRRLPRGRLQPLPQPGGRRRVDAGRRRLHAQRDAPDRRRRGPDRAHAHRHRRRPATAGAPPAANAAALAPYAQNPNFLGRHHRGGHHATCASDASKAYPSTRRCSQPAAAAGATFFDGGVQAVPRYPSNVYYNVSRQGQQLDEYNWIYVAAGRRRLRADRGRHDLPHDARDLGRVRDQREPGHVPPRRRQRPAAALHPPEQPRRLQPGAARDATRTRAASLYPVFGAPGRTATRRRSTARARRSCSSRTRRSAQTLAQQNAWAANRGQRHGVAAGRPRARQERGHGARRTCRSPAPPRARSTAGRGRAGSRSRRAPSRCCDPSDPGQHRRARR